MDVVSSGHGGLKIRMIQSHVDEGSKGEPISVLGGGSSPKPPSLA